MRKLILLILVVAAIAAAALFVRGGSAPKDMAVVIPEGASLTAAANVLEKASAIGSADAFLVRAKLFGGDAAIKPGEYAIKAGMSPGDILALLQSGRTLQRFFTVPEGQPSIIVAERLNKVPLLTGTVAPPREGSVLPDSYAYVRGETRAAVLGRMQKAMQTALANAWKARKPGIAVTTPEQALNLAAIVEKETGRADERRLVAAVYTNRLKRGMPLQADPTVIYPVTKGKPLGRRILRSELDADNGYNTYRRTGLPAGPITNPGKASIEAVLDPVKSNVIFFVAQGDGSSAFAETLDQHNANVQRWYAYRRSKGEM